MLVQEFTQPFRFSAHHRLRSRADFDRVFDQASVSIAADGVRVLARQTTLGFPRLGMILPKRVISSAVARNRTKRCIREWFRINVRRFGSYDIVVIVSTGKSLSVSPSRTLSKILLKWQELNA